MDIQTWTEAQEDQVVFHFAKDQTNILQELIKTYPGNQMNTEKQGRLFVKCHFIADRLKLQWLHDLVKSALNYQATAQEPELSNKQLLHTALAFENSVRSKKSRYLDFFDTGQGQTK